MPLLNYTTKVPAERTVAEVMTILAQKGALEIITMYDAERQPCGLKWRMETRHGPLAYALPVNVEAVFTIMTEQRVMITNETGRRDQARRTAWRILKDWIQAQMALLETNMVEMEEIFLPYMLSGEQTLYQALQANHFRALPSGAGSPGSRRWRYNRSQGRTGAIERPFAARRHATSAPGLEQAAFQPGAPPPPARAPGQNRGGRPTPPGGPRGRYRSHAAGFLGPCPSATTTPRPTTARFSPRSA